MSSPDSDSFNHSHDQRKRVGKACDRCRLKKSKCDGVSPCMRCTQDNAICEFGERKKISDRAFPKGYVEMIEEQQESITKGIRMMYNTLLKNGLWEGEPLAERNGQPLTHDILLRLGVLRASSDKPAPKFVDDLEEERQSMEIRQRQNSDYSTISKDENTPQAVTLHHESDSSMPPSPGSSISSSGSRKRTPLTPPSDHDIPLRRPNKKRPTSVNTKLRQFPQPASPVSRNSPLFTSSPAPYDNFSFAPPTSVPIMSPAFFLQSAPDSFSFTTAPMSQFPAYANPYDLSSNTTLAVDAFQDAQKGLMQPGAMDDYQSLGSAFASWA